MTKPYGGGKPTFEEFITPIGLVCHLYHDRPQLKTTDQHGRNPDIDPKTGIQRAEYKVTLAWSKQRQAELQALIDLAHKVKGQGWPGADAPGAFFSLEPFFRDGDNPQHNTQNREYLRGRYYLNFKQKAEASRNPQTGEIIYTGAPGLLGPNGPGDTLMPSDLYPGCTARASGIMFATEYMGKHYISTRLNNIQKYQDGERIGGGRPSADSQFGSINDGLGAQMPGAMPGFSSGLGAFGAQPSNFGMGQQQQPNRTII